MSRIVLAEDDRDVRVMLTAMLTAAGHDVVAAPDGEAAFHLATGDGPVPDLVVSDLRMPNLDGLGLVRRLRAHPVCGEVPFLLVTAIGQDERVEQVLEMPRTAVRPKPMSAPVLRAAIAELLSLS